MQDLDGDAMTVPMRGLVDRRNADRSDQPTQRVLLVEDLTDARRRLLVDVHGPAGDARRRLPAPYLRRCSPTTLRWLRAPGNPTGRALRRARRAPRGPCSAGVSRVTGLWSGLGFWAGPRAIRSLGIQHLPRPSVFSSGHDRRSSSGPSVHQDERTSRIVAPDDEVGPLPRTTARIIDGEGWLIPPLVH